VEDVAGYSQKSVIRLLDQLREPDMFRFITIIPLELWAIVLLLLFMWAAFGLNGFIITVLGLALLQSARWTVRR
jgi:hypothetical protein